MYTDLINTYNVQCHVYCCQFTYSMQDLKCLPTDFLSSMVKRHGCPLSVGGWPVGSSLCACREQSSYLTKEDKIKFIPWELCTLHPHRLVVLSGETLGTFLSTSLLGPTPFLQECCQLWITVLLSLKMWLYCYHCLTRLVLLHSLSALIQVASQWMTLALR